MIFTILVLLGLVFGSFVNAFVWRLHEQELLLEKKKKPTKQQLAKLSILRGRSMCPDCHHELAAKDLVPVFSWLSLRGRCRYCGKAISWQYPLVELATAILFGFSYVFWPLNLSGIGLFEFVIWLVFVVAFMSLTIYDLRWMLLPNKIVYPLIGIALVEAAVVALAHHKLSGALGPLAGALIISGLFYALFKVSDGAWIGGGDVKLAVVLGLLAAGSLKALLLIFLASIIGTIISLPVALKPTPKHEPSLRLQVPFGPFLLAATVIVVLFGTKMVDWYTLHLL